MRLQWSRFDYPLLAFLLMKLAVDAERGPPAAGSRCSPGGVLLQHLVVVAGHLREGIGPLLKQQLRIAWR
jgi:hypothetical protein